jgi:hypothetical protein
LLGALCCQCVSALHPQPAACAAWGARLLLLLLLAVLVGEGLGVWSLPQQLLPLLPPLLLLLLLLPLPQ